MKLLWTLNSTVLRCRHLHSSHWLSWRSAISFTASQRVGREKHKKKVIKKYVICKSPSAINFFSLYSSLESSRAFELEERTLIRDGAIDRVNPPRSRSVGFTSSRDIRLKSPVLHREKLHIHRVYFLCLIFSLLNEDVDNTTNEIFSVSERRRLCVLSYNYNIFCVVNSGKHSLSSVNFSFGEHTKAKRLKIYIFVSLFW